MIRAGRLYLTRPEPPEGAVLSACLQLCEYHPAVAKVWRQNVGAGKFIRPDGTITQFIRFGFPGLSDICGFMRDGRALFIETKKPSGRRRDEQDEFLALARAAGCVAGRVRSVDECRALIEGKSL